VGRDVSGLRRGRLHRPARTGVRITLTRGAGRGGDRPLDGGRGSDRVVATHPERRPL